jgi:hypothetical protein
VAEVLQIVGAIAVLVAFISVQTGLFEPRSYPSLALNLSGSALLAALALRGHQWGFFLLEASWAMVSANGFRARGANGSEQRPTLGRDRHSDGMRELDP